MSLAFANNFSLDRKYLPSILRCEVEGGFTTAVTDTGVTTILQQLCHHFRVTVLGSAMQRCLVVLSLNV